MTFGIRPNGSLAVELAAFGSLVVLEIVLTSLENREVRAILAALEADAEREHRLRDLSGR